MFSDGYLVGIREKRGHDKLPSETSDKYLINSSDFVSIKMWIEAVVDIVCEVL